MNGYTKAQFVGLITLIFIGLIILFIGNKVLSYLNRPEAKEIVQNENVQSDGFTLTINGNFVTYVGINEEYEEEGAKAYFNGKDISSDVAISYYYDDKQISSIDTKKVGSYTVKYEVTNNQKLKEVTRVVIVADNNKPRLVVPDTVTITTDEVFNYDVSEGVLATDNSGSVSFRCDNTLTNKASNYIIKCVAKDERGNEIRKNRLIKVVSGIEFEDGDDLTIKFPEGENYTYKYSLDDGKTWNDASKEEVLNVSGNVIALVLDDGVYKMSSTYYRK